MLCRDYAGHLQEAPPDLPRIIATALDGHIVLSATDTAPRRYQVRYGLQATDCRTPAYALEQFQECCLHSIRAGALDA